MVTYAEATQIYRESRHQLPPAVPSDMERQLSQLYRDISTKAIEASRTRVDDVSVQLQNQAYNLRVTIIPGILSVRLRAICAEAIRRSEGAPSSGMALSEAEKQLLAEIITDLKLYRAQVML